MGHSAWSAVMGVLLVGGCVAAPAEPTLGPPVSPADLIDIDNYRRLMDDALYTRLGDDRGYGPEHDLARDNIEDEMVAAGLDVELEAFEHGGDTWFNVVGSRVGTSRPDEVIVVGAHFDSVDNPGADDNATGTALVLELARALGSIELASTVRFVAFDREEQGKFGSAAFAEDHAAEIVSVLTADMIGQDHGARGYDLFSTQASRPLVDRFAAAIDEHGGGLSPFPQTGDNFRFSDHDSFEQLGIPAFVIIEASYGDNSHYHQATDAIDQFEGYIDYEYVEDLLRASAEFLATQ